MRHFDASRTLFAAALWAPGFEGGGSVMPDMATSVSPGGLRVLVIDDDDVAREMLCGALRDAGHNVHDLPSAIGATRAIFDQNIEAVVLDVMMPSINGDKLSRLLRQASKGKHLTIILVSSRPLTELNELASSAQADAVVPKGSVRKELALTLKRAHAQRNSGKSARQ
jgi:CheY-like chemotaxis protein